MNRIMTNLCINIEDFRFDENKKIIAKSGWFYFQGQRYLIENEKIIADPNYTPKVIGD